MPEVKKWKMKKRRKIAELIIKESAEIHSVISNEDGTFSLMNADGKKVAHAQHDGVGYLRDSGKPKFLRSITRDSKDLVGDNPWKKYDKIGFVDTNSIEADGEILYVCSPSFLLWQDESRRIANVHHVDLLVGFCSPGVNPERIGWQDFMQRLRASDVLSEQDKVLLVVDSDKSSIDSINTGKETVYGDYSLPANFALAYATSDAGAESWINKEMKRRDRVASSAISRILNDQELLAVVRAAGRVYVKNTFEQGA